MNSTYKLLSSFLFILVVLLSIQNKANAQTTLVSTDASGVVTNHAVTSDFPVFISTGNPSADDATFQAAKSAWLTANQLISSVWTPSSYIEIHQADYDAMPGNKQVAISGNTFYHIIP